MIITVVTTDGKRHVFRDQPSDIIEDVLIPVTSGTGFALKDIRGHIAYGPNSVARVVFQTKEE